MQINLVYLNYWQRKELLQSGVPKFPILRWWPSPELCEVEQVIFSQIKNRDTVLDVGAGNLRIKEKFYHAGYSGEYHTQDIGEEFQYNYATIDEIKNQYSAILCLDVIEHLDLVDGLSLIHKLTELLSPGGVMILQTPNGRCIRSPLASDMTHLHCYNISDLWSYLTCMGLRTEGYRVVWEEKNKNFVQQLLDLLGKYIITRLIGLDYADNIILIAHKPSTLP